MCGRSCGSFSGVLREFVRVLLRSGGLVAWSVFLGCALVPVLWVPVWWAASRLGEGVLIFTKDSFPHHRSSSHPSGMLNMKIPNEFVTLGEWEWKV